MAGNNTKIIFDVQANIDQLRGAASEIEKAFSKLNLPQSIQKSFTGTFDTLTKEIREFEVAAEKGFETLSDVSKGQRSLDKISDSFAKLKLLGKDISGIDMKKLLPDSLVDKYKKLQDAMKQVEKLQSQDNSKQVEKATTQYERQKQKVEELRTKLAKLNAENSSTKGSQGSLTKQLNSARKEADELTTRMKELESIRGGKSSAEYAQLKTNLAAVNNTIETVSNAIDKNRIKMSNQKSEINGLVASLKGEEISLITLKQKLDDITNAGKNTQAIERLRNDLASLLNVNIEQIPTDLAGIKAKIEEAASSGPELEKISEYIRSIGNNAENAQTQVGQLGSRFKNEVQSGVVATAKLNSEMDQLKTRLGYFFSIVNGVQLFKQAIRSAYESVKELDAAMTEMAVVTKYSVADLWAQMPQYAENANKLGATTLDVYKSMVLYTQQGLDAQQAQELSNQTLRMARIAGMEAADATDAMTSALRGFNMELTEASGQRVNDVYSNLAAHAAANTEEISNAMMRTASIAHGAGMEFETTAAFLTQMIETTREPAENLGTAMKTIIARFTEMKNAPTDIIDIDGEEVSVNKVDAALQSVGVSLKNTNGEFRDLDDVFLDLSAKWDNLSIMQQRYVATMAAGSRQQSRFIAMMSNYQRTMELTGYATNSAGASQKQFEKTMESLESKLNRLHNAWETFTTGIANATVIKGAVDLLTAFLTAVNKTTDALDPLHTGITKVFAALLGFKAAKGIVNGVLRNIGTQIATGMGKNGEQAATSFYSRFSAKINKAKINIFGGVDTNSAAMVKAQNDLTVAQNELTAAQEKSRLANEALVAAREKQKAVEFENMMAVDAEATAEERAEIIAENRARTDAVNAEVKAAETVATEANVAVKEAEIGVTTASTAAKEAETAAENIGLINKIKLYAALLFSNQAKKEEIRKTLAAAGAKWAEAGATGTATGAQWALNAALMACPLVWIIAAIAAVTAGLVALGIAIYNAVTETDQERLEKWTKTLDELNTQLSDVNNRVNDLQDGWSTLLDTKKELNELTQGTLEWKQKLLEVNQQVIDLINKMPELAQFVTTASTGELNISQSGYEYILNKQIEGVQRLQSAVVLAQAEKAEAQAAVNRNNYNSKWNNSFDERQNAKISYQSSNIQAEQLTSVAFDQLLDDYEATHNHLSKNNKILAKEVLANKKNLKIINEKQRNAKVDKALYGQLVGLTESQVQEQLDNEELSEDTIKATIAINEYQNEYANQLKRLTTIANSLNTKQRHSLTGTSALTETEIRKINTAQFKQFQNELGEIDLSDSKDYERAKELLGAELGFSNTQLLQLENAGADFEQIISELMSGQQSLSDYWNKIHNLTLDSQQIMDNYITTLENQIGSELSIDQLDTIGTFVEKVASNGGDIQKSIGYIEALFKDITNPEDLTSALLALNNISLDDKNFVETLTNKLSELGIEVDENVVTQLNAATKAANKFDLSNITGQLTSRNVAYADALTRKKDNDISFTDKEYEEYAKAFSETEYDISDYFLQNDDSTYTLIKSWKELIDVLYSATERVKEITKTTKEYNVASERASIAQQASDIFSQPYSNWKNGAPNAADILYGNLTNETNSYYNFSLDDIKEFFKDLPNATSVEDIVKILTQNEQGELDYDKISALIRTIDLHKNDEQFLKSIPEQVISTIKNLSDADLQKITQIGGMQVFSAYNGVVNALDGVSEHVQDIDINEDIDNVIEKVKQIPNISNDLVVELESLKNYPDKFKQKLDEILSIYSDAINGTSLASIQSEQEKALISGAQSARELVDLRQNNNFNQDQAENLKLYEQKLTSIVAQHKNWEQQLQAIQDEYGYTKQAALEILAIQYEQEDAVDNIISTLGDYEGVFTEPEGKGTTEYIEGIYSLVEEFQKIYGEDIDFTWVEENLEDIKKLKEGGEEAEAAMKRLGETSKAQKYSIDIDVAIDIDDLEKDETILDKLSSAFDSLSANAKTNSDIAQTKIGEIKSALEALDGSDASFEVKANTKLAFADLIRTGIAKAAVDGNINLLNYLVDLAYSGGFKVSGMGKIIKANVNNGQVSYTFSDDATSWTDYLQVSPWAEDGNGNLVYDDNNNPTGYKPTNTSTYTFTPSAYGSGSNISTDTSSSSSSDSDDDDDNWTNDWNMEYAILKKIAALERERNKLDKEHSRWVNSYALKEEEITKNKEKQRQNLMDQIDLNEDIIQRTKNELETLNWNSGFGGSIWFDQENNIIRTDDAHIRAMDEDTKEAFDDVKTEYENLASQLETAQDNIESAVEAIEELTAEITEIDYQTQIEKLIEIIDNTLSLYEKAEQRLSRSDRATTSRDITDLYKAQSEERVNKSDLLTESYIRSGAQLNALLNMGDYSKYYDFDWDTGTLKRNSAYYSIVDQDILDKVDTHLEKIESLAEQRRDADTERITLQDDQYEAEKDIADRANEWQQKVYDAVVKAREDEISSLENINTSIQNSASKLVDSIQKNIQRLRQNRKNNKTEEELANMQAKMAYLQVDTSTGNQVEIKKLQKQLDEKQESYTDSLIDQKITELQDQNKEAAEQRQKQIDIMKAQLSYDKQYGVLWGEVRSLIAAGIMSNGRINSNSELYKTLANWGSVDSLNSYKKKEFWAEQNYGAASYDANTTVSKSNYQDQLNYQISSGDYNSLYKSMADEVKTALSREVNETTPYKNYMHYNRSKNVLEQTELFPHPDDNLALHDTLQAMWSSVWERINYINGLIGYFDVNSSNTLFSHIPTLARYASGGLADFTGPAWLDGTTSEPEMVLNAKDTKNFIALKDILGAVLKNNNIESSKNGDFYCDIHINVEEIANDYDVERLAEELKRQIANDARYRNVNTINMIR